MKKRMTGAQFLARLRKTPRKWLVREDGFIRCKSGLCPIEAVAGTGESSVAEGAIDLGLSYFLVNRIINAPDFNVYKSSWRNRILKACGLDK